MIGDLAAALQAAGFPAVEAEGDLVHARLSAAEGAFTAQEDGGLWLLTFSRPVRASEGQFAEWRAADPDAPMDIHRGETRLALHLAPDDADGLHRWAALAEAAVVATVRWRKAQRDRGEGM